MIVGIIGVGNVGKPLCEALKYYHETVFGYDIKPPSDKWSDILETEVVFICVPTSLKKDGRLDNSIVEGVFARLEQHDYHGLVVVKSTLGLGFIEDAMERYRLDIVVFPEWLREKCSLPDTIKPDMTVIGTNNPKFVDIVLKACPWHKFTVEDKELYLVEPEEAVMLKLAANALATTKISFANQIQLICEKYGIDEKVVMNTLKKDPRCAPRYLNPGWAYGGACLPKDSSELQHSVKDNELLDGVDKINKKFIKRGDTKEKFGD